MRTKMNSLSKFIIIGLLINSSSCSNDDKQNLISKKETTEKQKIKTSNIYKSNYFYYYSPRNNKKYDHQFTGTNENGEQVNGIINLENEVGIGILKEKNNNEIEIISEDINYKEIIATDINGLKYKLKID
ncbi:hypothetical protein [Flavobacterium commune]|uniref:Uncharacterized protein n=1 Tax=Flavobacterium commune TaxID=1306519 RepID=A0A1D9P8C9_9FLAO|nr:hypothetical protein [Flavobacterium commune]AOZ98385.1 hypothetical protein BIW12_02470 [Flavobacterium commune]